MFRVSRQPLRFLRCRCREAACAAEEQGCEGDEILGRGVQAALDEQGGHEAVDQPAELARRAVELAAQLLERP